jgi:hypothetical protein
MIPVERSTLIIFRKGSDYKSRTGVSLLIFYKGRVHKKLSSRPVSHIVYETVEGYYSRYVITAVITTLKMDTNRLSPTLTSIYKSQRMQWMLEAGPVQECSIVMSFRVLHYIAWYGL